MQEIKIICDPANYWNGSHNLLSETLESAARAGAHYFKVQMFDPDYMGERWQYKVKKYRGDQLGSSDIEAYKDLTEKAGMKFAVTANHPHIVDILAELKVNNIKIASGQITEKMLDRIKKYRWDTIFISTGMWEDMSVLDLLARDTHLSGDKVVLMHCVSLYPTYSSEANLNRIDTLQGKFCQYSHVEIGYSDHCYNRIVPAIVMGKGVKHIEVHVKIGRSYGPTSEIAYTPEKLTALCRDAKEASELLGNGALGMQFRELETKEKYKDRYLEELPETEGE